MGFLVFWSPHPSGKEDIQKATFTHEGHLNIFKFVVSPEGPTFAWEQKALVALRMHCPSLNDWLRLKILRLMVT